MTFLATLGILTFVMTIGVSFKVTELLAKGVALGPLLTIFLAGIPSALMQAIPVSALVASLLVFGRLSADGEITGMRACGISLWEIIERPLSIATGLTVFCLINNYEFAPRGHYLQRSAMSMLARTDPVKLIEEGRFIDDFKDLSVYIGRKDGDKLHDIMIYDTTDKKIDREIRAKSGTIHQATNNLDLLVMLYDVRVDPFFNQDKPGYCSELPFVIKGSSGSDGYKRKQADFTFVELVKGTISPRALYPGLKGAAIPMQQSILRVELNERFILALSCFTFVLLGVPLGIKAHRKESTIGIAISLGFLAAFFVFIILAESLAKHPAFFPELIIWVPIVVSLALGTVLIRRGN